MQKVYSVSQCFVDTYSPTGDHTERFDTCGEGLLVSNHQTSLKITKQDLSSFSLHLMVYDYLLVKSSLTFIQSGLQRISI